MTASNPPRLRSGSSMRTAGWSWCLVGLVFAVMLTTGSSAGAEAKRRFISIGTGSPAGTYYKIGSALCDVVNADSKRLAAEGAEFVSTCSVGPSGGSNFNVRQVSIGAFTFGLVQSDTQHYAYHGTKRRQVRAFDGLRSVFSLYTEAFQVVVSESSGIESFVDLKKKRVNVGNPGSGTRDIMGMLMDVHGMTIEDLAEATALTSKETGPALCGGQIDAFVSATSFPAVQVASATNSCRARIIPVDTDAAMTLVADHSYFADETIPPGTYATTREEVNTFGVLATLVTSERVGDDVVYELVRAVMENLEALRAADPALATLDPRAMIEEGLTAPLHPGAVRYYKERGWM